MLVRYKKKNTNTSLQDTYKSNRSHTSVKASPYTYCWSSKRSEDASNEAVFDFMCARQMMWWEVLCVKRVTVTIVLGSKSVGYLLSFIRWLKSSQAISVLRGKTVKRFLIGGDRHGTHCVLGHLRQTWLLVLFCQYQQTDTPCTQCWKLGLVIALSSCATRRELSLSLPPPLQRQHKAMRDWRQSDVLRFILPESLRMLSVPHEGSDESRLSVCHLIIRQKKSLWCYPLTMAHSSLLTTVPTNNEELTAATNGDEVVPTVHLRVRRIK